MCYFKISLNIPFYNEMMVIINSAVGYLLLVFLLVIPGRVKKCQLYCSSQFRGDIILLKAKSLETISLASDASQNTKGFYTLSLTISHFYDSLINLHSICIRTLKD